MSIIIFFLLTIVGAILYGTFLSYEEKKINKTPKKVQQKEPKKEDVELTDLITNPAYSHLYCNVFYRNKY